MKALTPMDREREKKALAERLRQMRIDAGLSQVELAGLLGRSQNWLSLIERAERSAPHTDVRWWIQICERTRAQKVAQSQGVTVGRYTSDFHRQLTRQILEQLRELDGPEDERAFAEAWASAIIDGSWREA
ncbi:MAG: transcriptional regulator [Myxococcota bacterium]